MPATKAPYSLDTKSYAVFGQLEYRLTDLVGFTLGARFTNDKKDYEQAVPAPVTARPQDPYAFAGREGAFHHFVADIAPVLADFGDGKRAEVPAFWDDQFRQEDKLSAWSTFLQAFR